MLAALINDTHFGVRSDSQIFVNLQRTFFSKVFFPYCIKKKIKTVWHAGDLFDRRKYINFKTLSAVEEFFFKPLQENGMEMYVIAGNHDIYYKDTNEVNSLRLIAAKYDNIHVIDNDPETHVFDGREVAMVPWICRENYDQMLNFLKTTKAPIVIGHFEIKGFEFLPGIKNEEGLSEKMFERFDHVWSGHFHCKSSRGNITYTGAQYELTWSDAGQEKGFHVYDTKADKLSFVPNTNNIFEKIYYDDEANTYTDFPYHQYAGKYVKVIVINKTNLFQFDKFIDQLQQKNPVDVTIIEDAQFLEAYEVSLDVAQDTMAILDNYVEQMDMEVDKAKIKKILRELHTEALSVE